MTTTTLSLSKDADLREFLIQTMRDYYSAGRMSDAVCIDACLYVGTKVRDAIYAQQASAVVPQKPEERQ